MKELIKQVEALPLLVKIILAIPALDIIWGIYRIVKGVDANNTAAIIIGIVLLVALYVITLVSAFLGTDGAGRLFRFKHKGNIHGHFFGIGGHGNISGHRFFLSCTQGCANAIIFLKKK